MLNFNRNDRMPEPAKDPAKPAARPNPLATSASIPPSPTPSPAMPARAAASPATEPATAPASGEPKGSKLSIGPNINLKGVEISNCDVIVIEGNTIEGALYGISLNNQPFGDAPASQSDGSLIIGNIVSCPALPAGAAGAGRLYAIDCAASDWASFTRCPKSFGFACTCLRNSAASSTPAPVKSSAAFNFWASGSK